MSASRADKIQAQINKLSKQLEEYFAAKNQKDVTLNEYKEIKLPDHVLVWADKYNFLLALQEQLKNHDGKINEVTLDRLLSQYPRAQEGLFSKVAQIVKDIRANCLIKVEFRDLPPEVTTVIYNHLSPSDLGVFAQSSRQLESETAFDRLMHAAINAEPEFATWGEETPYDLAAIAILKRHPELLFRKKQIKDHYGRQIFGSPYQVFLGAGDLWAIRQIHAQILPLIEDGKVKAKTQFKEQFPNYDNPLVEGEDREARFYDERNQQLIDEIEKQLSVVKMCLDADPFTDHQPTGATKQAVEALCKLFQPTSDEVIKSGLHFPITIIDEIYKIYRKIKRKDHRAFFSLAVIKPALDASPTVDQQCYQQGLSSLLEMRGPYRLCYPCYQHPKGKPLSLTHVDTKLAATIIDPDWGTAHFLSIPSYHFVYRSSGECILTLDYRKSGYNYNSNYFLSVHQYIKLDYLRRIKMDIEYFVLGKSEIRPSR